MSNDILNTYEILSPMQKLLNSLEYTKILRKKHLIRQNLSEHKDFREIKIALLSASIIGEIKDFLEIYLLAQGIKPIFFEGQYNRYYEEVIFSEPSLVSFSPDIIYIHMTSRNIDFMPNGDSSLSQTESETDEIFRKITEVCEKITSELNSVAVINNFELLPYRVKGNGDIYKGGYNQAVASLNEKICKYADERKNVFINDINWLSAYFGLSKWYDNSVWYLYKYGFSMNAIPLFCDNLAKIIKSIFGMDKKILVLDGDNTLWGGIIGDDGAENIKIGLDSPEAEAFTDFQKYIKALQKQGVLLAVASKNEESILKSAFEHPSAVLSMSDFIAIRSDWQPKHTNIMDMKHELNLTLGGFVFADDNPAECDAIESFLPEVSCIWLDSPENYIALLDRKGFFERAVQSDDDANRTGLYRQNAEREQYSKNFADYNDYLLSLEMKCGIVSVNPENISRVCQLIGKTNQFNLTAGTITESELEHIISNGKAIALCARLWDKFGDNGIISVIAASIDEKEKIADIDFWVMSCRVFKRTVEYELFNVFVNECKMRSIEKIKGIYRRTSKNKPVESLYEEIGFIQVKTEVGAIYWELDIQNYVNKTKKVMEIAVK